MLLFTEYFWLYQIPIIGIKLQSTEQKFSQNAVSILVLAIFWLVYTHFESGDFPRDNHYIDIHLSFGFIADSWFIYKRYNREN